MKKKLGMIKSTAIPLDQSDIDTDQIIPARYLKATTRDGFGENLFRDLRFNVDNEPVPDFALNDERYKGEILIAGHNFGGGSSREHAAWALADYGFTAVISSFFADIFKSNALNNSLLPIQVSEQYLDRLFELVKADPTTAITIDLEKQTVSVAGYNDLTMAFDINAYKKICIMNGYDDIDYLVSLKSKTEAYEAKRQNDYSLT